MEFQALSLAPEMKKGPVYYHFSYRDSQPDRRGFTKRDSLIWSLRKIFENDFPNVGVDIRDTVINLIVELEVDHKNHTLLVTAGLATYILRTSRQTLTPETFNVYYNMFATVIEKDLQSSEERRLLQAKYRASFFRYLTYILTNSRDFAQ